MTGFMQVTKSLISQRTCMLITSFCIHLKAQNVLHLGKKNLSNSITTCGNINDQSQKLKINILNAFIRQPVIEFMRFCICWIGLDFHNFVMIIIF